MTTLKTLFKDKRSSLSQQEMKTFYDIATQSVWIHCPYGGYPIAKIEWSKDGKTHNNPNFVVIFSVFSIVRFVTSGLYYKTFRIVIYDRNNSTIVEPVL